MKNIFKTMRFLISLFALLFVIKTNAQNIVKFSGEKTSWHGFDRYDYFMDTATEVPI